MKFKRVRALLLATVMLLGVATSCGKGKDDGKIAITDDMSYDEKSAAIYANALGDFDKLYKEAKAEMNVSKRFALMAIAEAKIVDVSRLSADAVQILSTVEMTNVANNAKMTYTIVSESEANLREGKISIHTPIAQGLLNKKVGDVAEIKIPRGIIRLRVDKITVG